MKVCTLCLCLTLAAAVTRHSNEDEGIVLTDNMGKENVPVKQYLTSDGGMAYYGAMYIGGQVQLAIYDTGSFDLVVESKCSAADQVVMDDKSTLKNQTTHYHFKTQPKLDADAICCTSSKCPKGAYDISKSGQFKEIVPGGAPALLTYGSGPVVIKHCSDIVELKSSAATLDKLLGGSKFTKGSIGMSGMPVEVVTDHMVSLFQVTRLQAIVGIGAGDFKDREQRLATKMGIKRFTMCFQEDTNKDGIITWNDKNRAGQKGWVEVPVIGKMFWAVQATEWKLHNSHNYSAMADLGCKDGCGAVIDSGTSLMSVPAEVIQLITYMVVHGHVKDCSDMTKFPNFSFKFGGKEFSLPSTSYLVASGKRRLSMKVAGAGKLLAFPLLPLDAAARTELRLARLQGLAEPAVQTCTLMLQQNDPTKKTTWGPMVIFGMALFRKYAIQFDNSKDFEGIPATDATPTRVMRFFEADSDCHDTRSNGMSFREQPDMRRTHDKLQEVDLDFMRVSALQQKLAPIGQQAELHQVSKSKAAFKLKKSETTFDEIVKHL